MIVCCGESLIDMIPGPDGRSFIPVPGGCPFNTSIAAAKLGACSSFLGRLGKDFLSDMLWAELTANGVDTSRAVRRDEPTTLAFVQRAPGGDARYAFYSRGAADRSLEPADLPPDLGREARFLMTGSISALQEPIASTIDALIERERGRILLSIDPNIRPSLVVDRPAYIRRLMAWASAAAIVKASSEDLAWLFPEVLAEERSGAFLAAGAGLVVETRGDSGAVATTARLSVEAEAFAVDVADTIGAGDTFHAALLSRLESRGVRSRREIEELDGSALQDILRFSQAAAAIDCTRRGAKPPTQPEVQSFLSSR